MAHKKIYLKLKTSTIRWYEYSKQNIPVILTILASVLLTSTMRTHIAAITPLFSAESGFYMFVIMMLAALIMFSVFAFGKTQSLLSTVIFSLVSFLIIFVIVQYISLIVFETTVGVIKEGTNQIIAKNSAMNQSILIMGLSSVLYAISVVFAWIYTNYYYVKVVE